MRTVQQEPDKNIIVIQYNWEENLRKDEKAWVYFKKLNENSSHGTSGDGTFNVFSRKQRSITICHVPTNKRITFICPFQVLEHVHKKSIISLDVANSGLGVSVSIENELNVWETEDGTVRRSLEGHLFDVYTCCLFPSGVVILSGGADMNLKIWDSATGQSPVTLTGHTSAVNDTAIIDKGKNIISVSKDGTARLWNCAQAKCLATLIQTESEINCCSLIDAKNEISLPGDNSMIDEHEFGTIGKLLAVGCDSGQVCLVSVAGRETIGSLHLGSAVRSLCWVNNLRLVAGLEDGQLVVVDVNELNESPTLLSHDSASAVLRIKRLWDGILIGRRDGICQYYSFNGSSPVQLTGPNCDPVYSIVHDKEFIYTACRDAIVRKYKLQDLRNALA